MRRLGLFALLLGIASLAAGHNNWSGASTFGGGARTLSAVFTIGNKSYIATGTGTDNLGTKELWVFDGVSWTQKADFAGAARYGAIAFATSNKGYVGTGISGSTVFSDLWEYDPVGNSWTAKADFPDKRWVAVGVGINGKGYVGTGRNEFNVAKKDFWEYDPGTNLWTAKADYPGGESLLVAGFAIDTKGYFGTGSDGNDNVRSDFYSYNPTANNWTTLASFPGAARKGAAAFAIGQTGFLGTGTGAGLYNDFYQYEPISNFWFRKADYTGTARWGAAGFSINGRGYIANGSDITGLKRDVLSYQPDDISFSLISTGPYCAGSNNMVAFGSATFTFGIGNTFAVQLSDVNGNFISPNIIGTLATTTPGGNITVTFPSNLVPSTTYRIRVVSTSPFIVTPDNGADLSITASVTPAVTISATATTICQGATVNFLAVGLSGATGATFDWKRNGVSLGITSDAFSTSAIVANDIFTCVMTSGATCASPTTATSNSITMTVNPPVTPSVSIQASSAVLCGTQSTTFTATPVNGGTSPSYQWKRNGLDVGTNSPNYSASNFADNDVISVMMTSNTACLAPGATNPIGSNQVTLVVKSIATPIVTIAAPSLICDGANNAFVATPIDGGSLPTYQWKKNGVNVGNSTGTYVDATLVTGDVISTIMTSSRPCVTTPNVNSNVLTVTVTPVVIPTVTLTQDPVGKIPPGVPVFFNATSTNDGGAARTFEWKKNGIVIGTSKNTFISSSLANGDVISVSLNSAAACAQPTSVTASALTVTIDPTITRDNQPWESRESQNDINQQPIIRSNGVGFVVNGKSYVGLGTIPNGTGVTFRKDIWEYDPATRIWTQKADFGGAARFNAVAFTVGTKGYVGTGVTEFLGLRKDFWQYDPATNIWLPRADIPGAPREQAIAFSIASKGYVGTGLATGGPLKDFYEFDPGSNVWTARPDFGGGVRHDAVGFGIDLKGYVGTGMAAGQAFNDFWEFDPNSNSWNKKADLPAQGRIRATGFSMFGHGYVGLGTDGAPVGYLGDLWQYVVASNSWKNRKFFPGSSNSSKAAAMSVGPRGFVYKDGEWWEYNPFTIGQIPSKICTGETISVPYRVADYVFGPGNVFTAQLSTTPGFSVVNAAGSITSSANTGTIAVTIPSTVSGTLYFRIVASAPLMSTFPEIINVTQVSTAHVITAENGLAVCKDTPASFKSGLTGTGFKWYKNNYLVGIDDQRYTDATLVNGDQIRSIKTFTAGCADHVDIPSNTITMTVRTPAKPTVAITPPNILTSSAAVSYQWFADNLAITGATQQSYTMTKAATYKVMTTDINGCSAFSNDLSGIYTGLEDHASQLTVYPVPFTNELIVELPRDVVEDGVRLSLYSDTGQLVNQQSGQEVNRFNMASKASGFYLLVVQHGNLVRTVRVVKD